MIQEHYKKNAFLRLMSSTNNSASKVTMKKRTWSDISETAKLSYYVMWVLLCVTFSTLYVYYHDTCSRRFSFPSSAWTSASPFLATYQDERIESKISCDRSHYHYDLCSIKGPTVLDPTTSTFYAIGPTKPNYFIEKIRPYPRKWENFTMSKIEEVSLKSGPIGPQCDVTHNTSAVVFSAGGYTGNFFHDFNEGFLALFITVRSMSLSDQDVTLVIEKSRDWWLRKYIDLLGAFSKYPIINLDNETINHCFKSATLGLISHGFMTIDPKLFPKSTRLIDFHFFLDKAYNKAHKPITLRQMDRPKLVLLSRGARAFGVGRVILNEVELKSMAENMGFDVILFEPKFEIPLSETYGLLSSSHVMVGVHGAALTHLLFLRPGTIFIQVVPIGTDEVAEMCYGKPTKEMGLEYLEYKIKIEESSLIKKYNKLDPILQDPMSVHKKGWTQSKKVYLKQQNVNLDLNRFRKYLKYAYKKAKRFMYKNQQNM